MMRGTRASACNLSNDSAKLSNGVRGGAGYDVAPCLPFVRQGQVSPTTRRG